MIPRSLLPLVPLALAVLVATGAGADDSDPPAYYDRNEIPGHYTVGLYADRAGTSREVELDADEEYVEAFIGITGDSTQTFSAVVFKVETPRGVEMDGPIRWFTIPGLQQWNSAVEQGVQVEFNYACQEQVDGAPAMLGRVRLRVEKDFDRGEVEIGPHTQFGLSVELCDHYLWPKPFADGLPLTIERKKSFWSKLQSLFG